MSDTELINRVNDLEKDMILVKNAVQKELASQSWVEKLVQPIIDNTTELRHGFALHRQEWSLFMTTHAKSIADRAEQDKKEHEAKMAALEAQTWSNILKNKWAPLAAFIVAGAVILNHLATLAMTWLAVHGVPLNGK